MNFEKFKIRRPCPIGLDIGGHSIKMLQLAMQDNRPAIQAAKKILITPSIHGDEGAFTDYVVSSIKSALRTEGFLGSDVVCSIPNDILNITSHRLSATDDVEQALQKEVQKRFDIEPDNGVIDHLLAGSVQSGEDTRDEYILFAAENEHIKKYIDIVEAAELNLIALEPIACALFRNFERLYRREEDRERTMLLIDIGNSYTTVVFARSDQINFIKQLHIGGRDIEEEICRRLDVNIEQAGQLHNSLIKSWNKTNSNSSDDNSCQFDPSTRQVLVESVGAVSERIANEISICFRYYTVTFRGKRVEQVLVSGGQAHENILLNVLKRHLIPNVEVWDPMLGINMNGVCFSEDRRSLKSEWAAVVGMALKTVNVAHARPVTV
ncbi:MAG: pilus assembly protein PilM [Phycisphaerae bacterium]|nr:pilus assembly protein PilM [Phycisphaerae bacterium]